MGFYKQDGGTILVAEKEIITKDGTFTVAEKDNYTYPIAGGWFYFDSYNDAENFFNGLSNNKYTSLEFLDKFTEAEQLAIVSATLANAQVKLWYDKMLAASFVGITDPRTIGGLSALVAAGLLTEARKAEILTPELVS